MFYTVTPAGSIAGVLEPTAEKAIKQILIDAAHMPYRNWGDFLARGYSVEYINDKTDEAEEISTSQYSKLSLKDKLKE